MAKEWKTFNHMIMGLDSSNRETLAIAIGVDGPRDCPSPDWDKTGRYRVALVAGKLTIQKLQANNHWAEADLRPPVTQARLPYGELNMETKTRSRNILFLDVSGWSKLGASEIQAYVTLAMPELAKEIIGSEFLNTWGDAIVAIFESAKDAAESALRIRDFFRRGVRNKGISPGLTCRIALHQGEILLCPNSILKREDIFGEAVHVAARLEPATTPDHVFCTEAFARALGAVDGVAPKAYYFGPITLPKKFGTIKAHVVTWANEPSPIPHLKPGSSPKDRKTPAANRKRERKRKS